MPSVLAYLIDSSSFCNCLLILYSGTSKLLVGAAILGSISEISLPSTLIEEVMPTTTSTEPFFNASSNAAFCSASNEL